MSHRLIIWSLVLALVLGCGWYKAAENQRDLDRQAAWRDRFERLQAQSPREHKALRDWLRSLASHPNARQQVAAHLNNGQPLEVQHKAEWETAEWTHPDYGIQLTFSFWGDKLVGHGVRSGKGPLLSVHPQPLRMALTSRAETVRRMVTQTGPWLWLAALLAAVACRGRHPIAAEAMLAVALVCGAAWLVAPNYPLTLRGVFSNDPLFLAAVMHLTSLAFLAWSVAPSLQRPPKLQFSLRTLLGLTGGVAVLLVMGPFGYIALCVFAVSAAVLLGSLRLALERAARHAIKPGA